jgi:AcrR family transcriptional regulator
MCARPRSASDEAIFAATARVVGRVGPARLTLAAVAAEVGISAPALVQRFGGKRELLVAMSRAGVGAQPRLVDAARARAAGSALAAILAYAEGSSADVADPDAFANHLALLQMDLADADLRASARAWFARERRAIAGLLGEAVAAGELPPATDPERLAVSVQAALQGARLLWAVERRGALAAAVRRALEGILPAPARIASGNST